MTSETMTVWGFWITVAGTVLGLISLVLALYIGVNTSKIKGNLMKKHLEKKYRKTKRSIMVQLITSYNLLKEDNILDNSNIDECIISLSIYDEILSRITKSKLKTLSKKLNDDTLNNTFKGKNEIRKLLYELIKRLENELDEQDEYLKEVTK